MWSSQQFGMHSICHVCHTYINTCVSTILGFFQATVNSIFSEDVKINNRREYMLEARVYSAEFYELINKVFKNNAPPKVFAVYGPTLLL